MTRLDILMQRHEMAVHNLYCYSANLLMTEPKSGYEKQWRDTDDEIEILEDWIAELTGAKVNI